MGAQVNHEKGEEPNGHTPLPCDGGPRRTRAPAPTERGSPVPSFTVFLRNSKECAGETGSEKDDGHLIPSWSEGVWA